MSGHSAWLWHAEIQHRLEGDGELKTETTTGKVYDTAYGFTMRAYQQTCSRCAQEFLAADRTVRKRDGMCSACWDVEKQVRADLRKKWPVCRVRFKTCVTCGRVFTARGPSKTCSAECALERKRLTDSKANRRPVPTKGVFTYGVCFGCGATTDPHRFTCDPCKQEARKQRRKRDKQRRAALKRAVAHEPYTMSEIALRDRFRCGLCGERVAMKKQCPHPRSPTIDHIIPVSHGGDETKANVQLAHFICNSIKSNGGGQQLRLVG